MDRQDIKEYDIFYKYGIRHNDRGRLAISKRYFLNTGRGSK